MEKKCYYVIMNFVLEVRIQGYFPPLHQSMVASNVQY